STPVGIAYGGGLVYVTESSSWPPVPKGPGSGRDGMRVQAFGPDGAFVRKWGRYGFGEGELNIPMGIAVGVGGDVYVADTYNNRIQRFSPEGRLRLSWGGFGIGAGQLNCPQGIAAMADGSLVVADTCNNRVLRYSPDGELLGSFGDASELWLPCGVAMGAGGLIYVADTMNNKVKVYDASSFGAPEALGAAAGLAPAAPARESLPEPAFQGADYLCGLGDELMGMAKAMGACHFGVADLTKAYAAIPDSFEECGEHRASMMRGVSVGVLEDAECLMGLPQTDDDYRTKHYADKISLAVGICDGLAAALIGKGYRAYRLAHPPKGKATGLYKLAARHAGLGFIGKNRLFVSPVNGCHVALGVLVTDAPLAAYAGEPMAGRCGDCFACVDACPVHAYGREPFGDRDSLDGFDTGMCGAMRGIINPTGWGVCGLCVKACPYGKRPLGESFHRVTIEGGFTSESVGCGDLNRDGVADVVAGPHWYEGPDFTAKHVIFAPPKVSKHTYSPTTQPCFVHDISGDGWPDVLYVMRRPGSGGGYSFEDWGEAAGWEAVWHENPGDSGEAWKAHVAVRNVANEAPVWGDLDGDGLPELIYSDRERYGYAKYDPLNPTAEWMFHPISDTSHIYLASGVGFGDIGGDGNNDVVCPSGWWEAPPGFGRVPEGSGGGPGVGSGAAEPHWVWHPYAFAKNAAQMLVFDVDGDGLSDVVTVWDCHGYGLVWHRQVRDAEGNVGWEMKEILPINPDLGSGALRLSQMHSLEAADLNGDGLTDLIVGKRHWAHGEHGDPEPGAPAALYWFELSREGGAHFTPRLISADSGAGTHIVAADLTGDGRPDVLTSGKKGTYAHYNGVPKGLTADHGRRSTARMGADGTATHKPQRH
ncbi:MAG: FG-GAP-like repeat-containing protein, partial [Oscillospiraceae bacterium]|nr:FG-GAP-like repeat-containing protein [Oscillospiraceae bacterium]